MVWRIAEQVTRGEIDNRVRGEVTGRIWFAGRDTPLELKLSGNPWRDLAGRRLEFINPTPKSEPDLVARLGARQTGAVGDMTASRKVKVPDVDIVEWMSRPKPREPLPFHWANSLYLEWYSDTHGRVVIETVDYQLTLGVELAWEITAEDEEQQRVASADALADFTAALAGEEAATEDDDEDQAGESAEWAEADGDEDDDVRPQTEAEADAMLEENDRLLDRITARLDREGEEADFDQILEEELERRRAERGEPSASEDGDENDNEHDEEQKAPLDVEEMNRISAEAKDDPELDELVRRKHRLAIRAQQLAVRLMSDPDDGGWVPDGAPREHPVIELANGAMCAAGKFAGALNGAKWPPTRDRCGLSIAWLKRARDYIEDARRAADSCAEEKLVPDEWLIDIRAELEAITAEADALIAELRGRLQ